MVAGVEDDVKTLYSKKWMPVDPILAAMLLQHKERALPGQTALTGSLSIRRLESPTGLDGCRNII